MNPYRSTKPGRRPPTLTASPMIRREEIEAREPFEPALLMAVIALTLLVDRLIVKAILWSLG